MSKKIKSIRENYATLLTAFKSAGVNLTESQKTDIDKFVLALENKIDHTKETAIRATKKVVEKKMENEYRKVFESILKHKAEHDALAGKIQTKIAQINESKKLARNVDRYLDLYLEEVLPEQKIVDYDKMNKLQNLVESLKDTLLINDEAVEAKAKQIQEAADEKTAKLESQIKELKTDLNESMKKTNSLKKQIDNAKTIKFINEKTEDLPLFEARQIKKRMMGMTYDEATKSFKKILESVQKEIDLAEKEEENTLQEDIAKIIEAEDCTCKPGDEKCNKACNKTLKVLEETEPSPETETDEEDEDLYKDESLTESEKINKDMLMSWITTAGNINKRI